MLNHEIKFVFSILLFCLFSCKDKPLSQKEQKQYDIEQMQIAKVKREIFYNYSKTLVGKKEYYRVYNNAKDTIINWTKNGLKYTHNYKNSLLLDSLICFNANKNKCIMALGTSYGTTGGDNIVFFYGMKVKKKWFFFEGATVYLPREYYQKNVHIPLSKKKLKEIAIQEIYGNYLKETLIDKTNKKVKYEINDGFFQEISSKGWCMDCKTEEDFEDFVIGYTKTKWIPVYVPLKDKEIKYDYKSNTKTLSISFPIHAPGVPKIKAYEITIRHKEKYPKDNNQKEIDKYRWVEAKKVKTNQTQYTEILTDIKPNTVYTFKIKIRYSHPFNDGTIDESSCFYVTDFKTPNK